jgi:hypothetical protein
MERAKRGVIHDEDKSPRNEVPKRGKPFRPDLRSELGQVVPSPSLPDMLDHHLNHLPTVKAVLVDVRQVGMRQGDERTTNQKMAWGQDSAVIGIFSEGCERARVEDRFDVTQKSVELLRGEMTRTHDSSQVVFHAFDPRLPETTVMRSYWGVEIEGDAFGSQKVTDSIFVGGRLEKGSELG